MSLNGWMTISVSSVVGRVGPTDIRRMRKDEAMQACIDRVDQRKQAQS